MKHLLLTAALATASPAFAQQSVMPVPWAEVQPTYADYRQTYPSNALAQDVEGDVRLLCTVTAERKLDCVIHSETPADYGFGEAALSLSRLYVTSERDPRVQPGARVMVPIAYRLAYDE